MFDPVPDHDHASLRQAGRNWRIKTFQRWLAQHQPSQNTCRHPMANDKQVLLETLLCDPVGEPARDIVIPFPAFGPDREKPVLHIDNGAYFCGNVGIGAARPSADVNFQQAVIAACLVPVGIDLFRNQRQCLQGPSGGRGPELRPWIIAEVVMERPPHDPRLHAAIPGQRRMQLRLTLHACDFVEHSFTVTCDENPFSPGRNHGGAYSLSHVQSVVERRNTIPILSNVLIEASDNGQIKLMATDLDLQIVETFAADVETPGATTVSAHTLFDIARKLPDGSQVQLRRRRWPHGRQRRPQRVSACRPCRVTISR
jgi:hypothetical protein